MYETIEWLLDLPETERAQMEKAIEYPFTMKSRAAERYEREMYNQLACTLNVGTMEGVDILLKRGLKPAALNFAHSYNCGGGFEHASGSQEEACFRVSSLFQSLWPHRRKDDGPGVLARGQWIGDFDEDLP